MNKHHQSKTSKQLEKAHNYVQELKTHSQALSEKIELLRRDNPTISKMGFPLNLYEEVDRLAESIKQLYMRIDDLDTGINLNDFLVVPSFLNPAGSIDTSLECIGTYIDPKIKAQREEIRKQSVSENDVPNDDKAMIVEESWNTRATARKELINECVEASKKVFQETISKRRKPKETNPSAAT